MSVVAMNQYLKTQLANVTELLMYVCDKMEKGNFGEDEPQLEKLAEWHQAQKRAVHIRGSVNLKDEAK